VLLVLKITCVVVMWIAECSFIFSKVALYDANVFARVSCVGLLIEQLSNGSYECMICYNVVKRETAVWNCSNCYHIYHLYCIKKWANSSQLNSDSESNGWRCPACQNITIAFPNAYMCFCGMLFLCYFSGCLLCYILQIL